MSYDAKNELVEGRQLKVQSLSIPLAITGNATPASVVCRNDEPALLFLQTEGVNQITSALATNETATYTTASDDSDGIFRVLVKISEPLTKVISVCAVSRTTFEVIPGKLGSTSGITTGSGGGQSIMAVLDSAVDLSAASLDACLIVQYVVTE